MEPTALSNKAVMFTNRQLISLMVPLMLEQLLALSVGLADSIMVASVGDAAISAVSLVDSICNLMIYAFSAMAAGGAVVAGQCIGHGEKDEACRAGQQLMALLLVVSVAVMGLMYLFRNGIIAVLFGEIEADVLEATYVYYDIVIASIPAIALYNGGAALFRTMSRSDISLNVSLLMNGLNVVGNAILIYGFGFDVSGAAIPTLVSRVVAAMVILAMLFDRKYLLNLSNLRAFRVEKRLLRNIFTIAIPSGIENSMFHFGRLVLVSMVATLGTAGITANAIGNTIGNFHCCIGMGVNLGIVTVISQCVGAGEYGEARRYFKKIMLATYVIAAVVNVLLLLATPAILRIYDVTPEAAEQALIILVMHGVSAIVIWLPAFMIPQFLRAAGDAQYSMVVGVGSMWLVRVLFAYIFGIMMGYGLPGIWFAHSVLDWVVRSVLFYGRYRSGVWERKSFLRH